MNPDAPAPKPYSYSQREANRITVLLDTIKQLIEASRSHSTDVAVDALLSAAKENVHDLDILLDINRDMPF